MATVLNASSSLPPVVVTGWPEGVRLVRPKALTKNEQLLLQAALDKSLISMTCLHGEEMQAPLVVDSGEGNVDDEREQLEIEADRNGDEGEASSSGGVWAGPLAAKASQLF
jgi:hypothetical protein